MYDNLANRGEVTKEIIHNAVNQGAYEFYSGGVEMSYGDKAK